MTAHASHGIDAAAALSPADWDELHADDIVAAKVVVGLMMSIFSIGLILYTIVAVVVGS